MQETKPTFATFWAGARLSAYEAACLNSFVVRGYQTILYSYDEVMDVPQGVEILDASAIASRGATERFIYQGKPNLGHFSDYFRYLMFQKTDHIWVDADILLLKPPSLPPGRMLLTLERTDSINGAVMRLDRTRPELARVITATEALMDRELLWGDTGPRLVTNAFGRSDVFKDVLQPAAFFPIPHDDCWKMFLPQCREECERLCGASFGLHLWNNIVEKMGIWKSMAPPEGSFLAQCFAQDNSLRFFRDTYPEKVMQHMLRNWRMRQDGSDLGIGNLARQLVPSVRRTAGNYRALSFLAPKKN